jgi:hypothetical protein
MTRQIRFSAVRAANLVSQLKGAALHALVRLRRQFPSATAQDIADRVATRQTKHFADSGVTLVNPWAA